MQSLIKRKVVIVIKDDDAGDKETILEMTKYIKKSKKDSKEQNMISKEKKRR